MGDVARPGQSRGRIIGHLLDQPDAVRLGGVELIAGEQPAHGVAPAGLAGQADRRTAERVNAPPHFELGESGTDGGDADVGGQQQLDAQCRAPAVRDRDQRRGPRAIQPPWVPAVVGEGILTGSDARADVGEIQTGGEVVAVREQHPGSHRGVGLQQRVGAGEIGEHRAVKRVAFVRSVQADQQNVTVTLQRHSVQSGKVLAGRAVVSVCHRPSESHNRKLCNKA